MESYKRDEKREMNVNLFSIIYLFSFEKKKSIFVVVVFYKLFDLDEENFIDEIQYIIYSSCKKLEKINNQTNQQILFTCFVSSPSLIFLLLLLLCLR